MARTPGWGMGHPSLSRTRDPPLRLACSAIQMPRPSPTGPQGLSTARPGDTLTTGGTWTVNERQHFCLHPVFMGAPHEPQKATCYHGLPKWGTKLGSSTLVRATSDSTPEAGQAIAPKSEAWQKPASRWPLATQTPPPSLGEQSAPPSAHHGDTGRDSLFPNWQPTATEITRQGSLFAVPPGG